MDIVQRFKAANLCRHVNVASLEIGRPYSIQYAELVNIRFGSSVVMVLQHSTTGTVRVFIPRRYGVLISDEDITNINTRAATLSFAFGGTCPTTNSDIISLE
jgi:putative AlgH/UPF0301 family transcriptional regulator